MEIYTANHSETVENLLVWPWRRFEKFYEAFMKRRLLESLESRKEDMISALWANSNYDDDKGSRKSAIEEIERNFEEATFSIINDQTEEEADIDEDNPFFASGKRAIQKMHGVQEPFHSDGTVEEAVESEKFIDGYKVEIDQ